VNGIEVQDCTNATGVEEIFRTPRPDPRKPEEMIDIEARVTIKVDDVDRAAKSVRALVVQHGGAVSLDSQSSSERSQDQLNVRIPSARFEQFFDALGTVGTIRQREVKMSDVTLEVHDADVVLRNLEATLKRYEAILQQAKEVKDVLAVEVELARVRTSIDKMRVHLALLRDRVSRATVAIVLFVPRSFDSVEFDQNFFPALRATTLVDLREGTDANAYIGGGLSFQFTNLFSSAPGLTRGTVFDFELDRSCCGSQPEESKYAFAFLVGGDYYSALLGAGRRRWFNPFIGWRTGVTGVERHVDFAAGVSVGLEILKTKGTAIDLRSGAIGLVGNPKGPHAAVLSSFNLSAAF